MDWDRKLQSALWAYCTSFKTNISTTPFRQEFGLEAIMPIEFEIPTLQIQVQEQLPEHKYQLIRAEQLLILNEERLDSEHRLERNQLWRKAFVNRHAQRDHATLRENAKGGVSYTSFRDKLRLHS